MTNTVRPDVGTPITCAVVQEQMGAYLANQLDETLALALEAHAATCADCEHRLDQATRLPALAFAPEPPVALREATRAAVQAARDTRDSAVSGPYVGTSQRWSLLVGAAALASAAVLVVQVSRAPSDTEASVAEAVAVALVPTAQRLADGPAAAEFAAIDAAARELDVALASAPDDAELRQYRASVRARRDELARRVQEATE